MLCVDTILKPGLPVPGFPVSAATAVLPALSQEIDYIISGLHLSRIEFFFLRTGGKTNMPAPGIHAKHYRLRHGFAFVKQLYRKRAALNHLRPAGLQQSPDEAVPFCRHKRLPGDAFHVYHIGTSFPDNHTLYAVSRRVCTVVSPSPGLKALFTTATPLLPIRAFNMRSTEPRIW